MSLRWKRAAARRLRGALAASCLGVAASASGAPAQDAKPLHLRVVGGIAGVNQYVRHEEPFWTRELPRLTHGRVIAEIVPFDRAGLRGQEMLRMIELGAVSFGTVLLNAGPLLDPELALADMALANPDMATLRRSVDAARPLLDRLIRERYGGELLAIYTYPAQELFCTAPVSRLSDLKGRRVRTANASQSDVVDALGGTPVPTAFAEIIASVRRGSVDCVITGSMSGNTIGLHEMTTHLLDLPITWGVAAFVANGAAWQALPADLRPVLRQALARLEAQIWRAAEIETADGIACNAGTAGCVYGRRGRMTVARPGPEVLEQRRQLLLGTVLPRWFQRCGTTCVDAWRRSVGPAIGVVPR